MHVHNRHSRAARQLTRTASESDLALDVSRDGLRLPANAN